MFAKQSARFAAWWRRRRSIGGVSKQRAKPKTKRILAAKASAATTEPADEGDLRRRCGWLAAVAAPDLSESQEAWQAVQSQHLLGPRFCALWIRAGIF